jgi:hypothetical protein
MCPCNGSRQRPALTLRRSRAAETQHALPVNDLIDAPGRDAMRKRKKEYLEARAA